MQKKLGAQQREAGKKISRGPGLNNIKVGPPAAKRRVGKQKPLEADDSKESSSKRREVAVSYPHNGEDELDRIAKEVNLQFTTRS